ncbi:MAG: DUF5522 domain-containing protein [Bacteroidota bacterium]
MGKKTLIENKDYYIENGYWVFTEHFHLDRGYCCGNICRHCPYDHENVPDRKRQSARMNSKNDEQ